MSLQSKFFKFLDNIKLGREDKEYKDAREKDDSILIDVKEALRSEGYPVIENFLQGSQSTHTAIRHSNDDFDIDRSVVIDYQKAPNDPVDPKKIVLKVLEKRGFKNAKIKKPCVTADYKSLNLYIDIPIYRKQGDTYELAVGKFNSTDENKEWSLSDPKGLSDFINNKDDYIGSASIQLAQYKRLARYIKRWRDHKFSSLVSKKIFSIGLTVMLKEKFVASLDNDGNPDDLDALRKTVQGVLEAGYFSNSGYEKYRVTVCLPVAPYRDIFHNSSLDTGTQLYNKLTSLKEKLDKVNNEVLLKKQCQLLQDIFGDDFEVPSDEKSNISKKAAYVSPGIAGTSQGA
jgi:hypothetical protein